MDEIATLEPFGEGNEEPIFEFTGLNVIESRGVGKEGKHLRMVVMDEYNRRMTLIAFAAPEEWMKTKVGDKISAKLLLDKGEWNGKSYVEGRILELRVEKSADI